MSLVSFATLTASHARLAAATTRTAAAFARFTRRVARVLAAASVLLLASGVLSPAFAVIPASERALLLALYTSANGAGWTNSTGWNGAVGTECTWFGVQCNAGDANVTSVVLSDNHLAGPLPGTLNHLTQLRVFQAESNFINGSLPSLAGLTSLEEFLVGNNVITGPIPSLAGLTALQTLRVSGNQLTGLIPSLTGLTSLRGVFAGFNQLSGFIPSLAGLPNLSLFKAQNNQLTGGVPTPPTTLQDAALCPNLLVPVVNAVWDAATGLTPWSQGCTGVAQTLTVTPSAGANGSISPAIAQTTSTGLVVTFTLIPNAGYAPLNVLGDCGGMLTGNVFTTEVINANCNVIAAFRLLDVPVPTVATNVPTLATAMLALLALMTAALGAALLKRKERP